MAGSQCSRTRAAAVGGGGVLDETLIRLTGSNVSSHSFESRRNEEKQSFITMISFGLCLGKNSSHITSTHFGFWFLYCCCGCGGRNIGP